VEVSVKIHMRGETHEVEQWLRRFGAADVTTSVEDALEAVVTDEVADRLIQRITPDARRALRFIAEHAPEAPWDDVQAHLNMDGLQAGGVMASFGFAEKAGLPRPYRNDRGRRVYFIDPEVASIVLKAIERFEDSYGQVA
jgi:hypothetical protein